MFIPRRILAVLLIGAAALSLPGLARAADEDETPKSASVKPKAKASPSTSPKASTSASPKASPSASPKKTPTSKSSDGSSSGTPKKAAVSGESKKSTASEDSKKSDPSDKPASKKTDKPASQKEESKKPEAKKTEAKKPAAEKPAAEKSEKSDKAESGKPESRSDAQAGSKKPEGASSDSAEPRKSKKSKAKPKPATLKRHTKPGADSDSAPRRHPEAESKPEPEKKPEPKIEREKSAESRPEPRQLALSLPQPGQSAPATRAISQPSRPVQDQSVIVTKSGAAGEEEEAAPTPAAEPERHRWWWPFGHASHYKYLTPRVRDAIDDARVPAHKWRYIVVHNSGTRQGSAKAFDYYHRYVRKMPNGLAYHFVIGNGTSTADGAIEIGPRWVGQLQGGHVHSDYLNSIALGVCLVGDYNKERPTQAQLEALDELVKYLRKRVGKTDHHLAVVKPHRDINPPQWPTDCPGDRFPYQWLNDKFEDQ